MIICIRIRIMHLISDKVYAYVYGRFSIYRPLAFKIHRMIQVN